MKKILYLKCLFVLFCTTAFAQNQVVSSQLDDQIYWDQNWNNEQKNQQHQSNKEKAHNWIFAQDLQADDQTCQALEANKKQTPEEKLAYYYCIQKSGLSLREVIIGVDVLILYEVFRTLNHVNQAPYIDFSSIHFFDYMTPKERVLFSKPSRLSTELINMFEKDYGKPALYKTEQFIKRLDPFVEIKHVRNPSKPAWQITLNPNKVPKALYKFSVDESFLAQFLKNLANLHPSQWSEFVASTGHVFTHNISIDTLKEMGMTGKEQAIKQYRGQLYRNQFRKFHQRSEALFSKNKTRTQILTYLANQKLEIDLAHARHDRKTLKWIAFKRSLALLAIGGAVTGGYYLLQGGDGSETQEKDAFDLMHFERQEMSFEETEYFLNENPVFTATLAMTLDEIQDAVDYITEENMYKAVPFLYPVRALGDQ